MLGRDNICHIVKMLSLKILFATPGVYFNDDQQGSTRIVNFMTPGAGVLELGCGHISHIENMHYFFKSLLLYSQAKTDKLSI